MGLELVEKRQECPTDWKARNIADGPIVDAELGIDGKEKRKKREKENILDGQVFLATLTPGLTKALAAMSLKRRTTLVVPPVT